MRIVLTSIGLMVVFLIAASSSFALDPGAVADGNVWLLDSIVGAEVPDDSANSTNGVVIGDPVLVPGANGMALKFDGVDDGVHIPDSDFINVTNGPWPNRTVTAAFNCADVSKQEKQTVFEEGGLTRGITIYVFDGQVYVGAWNKAEYLWDGAWISAPIKSNEWHGVAAIIRDGIEGVEDDKFEMWMDGELIGKAPGGQMYNHANDNAIGYTKENNVFHDGDAAGDGWYFEGIIDEVWVLNIALSEAELGDALTNVEPASKLTSSWGAIKSQL